MVASKLKIQIEVICDNIKILKSKKNLFKKMKFLYNAEIYFSEF